MISLSPDLARALEAERRREGVRRAAHQAAEARRDGLSNGAAEPFREASEFELMARARQAVVERRQAAASAEGMTRAALRRLEDVLPSTEPGIEAMFAACNRGFVANRALILKQGRQLMAALVRPSSADASCDIANARLALVQALARIERGDVLEEAA